MTKHREPHRSPHDASTHEACFCFWARIKVRSLFSQCHDQDLNPASHGLPTHDWDCQSLNDGPCISAAASIQFLYKTNRINIATQRPVPRVTFPFISILQSRRTNPSQLDFIRWLQKTIIIMCKPPTDQPSVIMMNAPLRLFRRRNHCHLIR